MGVRQQTFAHGWAAGGAVQFGVCNGVQRVDDGPFRAGAGARGGFALLRSSAGVDVGTTFGGRREG